MDPIDISSDSVDSAYLFDDDDLNFDSDQSTERESTNSRILPPTADAVAPDSRDSAHGWHRQAGIAGSSTAFASNGSTSKENNHSFVKQHSEPSTSEGIRASNRPAVQSDESLYGLGDGNRGLHRTVNSQIANVSVTDYEKLSSQQAFKRTLPPSYNRSSSNSKSNNLDETASSSRARDISPPFGSSEPFNRPMAAEERVSVEDERLIYQAALEDLNQPKLETDPPDGLLSVSLLRHQKIALTWMLQKEMRSLHCLGGILADDQGLGKTISMIALIQMQKHYESKAKSEDQSSHKPEALNLDDDDENGCSGLTEVKQPGESDDFKPTSKVSASSRAFRRKRPAAGTLVVCPASVLRQWARELQEKVPKKAKLTFLLYHGGTRTRDPVELAKYDVVLTTYAIVTNEIPKQPIVDEDEVDNKDEEKNGLFSYNKRKKKTASFSERKKKGFKGLDGSSGDYDSGPLARVAWCRVVLDEAQTIKNHRTQVARACCSLRAKRRWCLSGTPIQNTIDDLYSYFRFLRYDPYAVYKSFYNAIKLPISQSSLNGYKKLQAVLRAIMLRRTKGTLIDGQPIIKLPPKSIHLKTVDFSTEERAFYTRLEADSRSKFKAYAAAGTVGQNYANILLMLLRLRQACDHPLLVKGSTSDSYGKESAEMVKALPDEMVVNLLNSLATSSAICQVCNDPPEDPIVTMCNHVFCYQCVYDYLTGEENTCPAPGCKEQLDHDIVFSEATLRSRMSGNLSAGVEQFESDARSIVLHNEYSSSKIRAVLEILLSDRQSKRSSQGVDGSSGGPIKTMIFSQWTGMLDLVQASLEQYQIEYRRLDGTMTLTARDKAVKDFNSRDEVMVMIMSLKAGNLGLNMVAASRVILLDLWWNPTTEDQAIDRAHRIGQTRPVTVTRLTIKDTVEDRILALQEEKRKIVASAFGEDSSGGAAARLTVHDLKYLFMGSRGPRV